MTLSDVTAAAQRGTRNAARGTRNAQRATSNAQRATFVGVLALLALLAIVRLLLTAFSYGVPAWFDEELNPLIGLLSEGQPITRSIRASTAWWYSSSSTPPCACLARTWARSPSTRRGCRWQRQLWRLCSSPA